MKDIVFRPIVPLPTMLLFTIIFVLIVLINRKHIINRIIILALLLAISQRPMLRNQADLTYSLDIDVLFVIDNTVSMNAIDVNNDTRFKQVKKDCEYLVDRLSGANFGLITFSNFSQVRMPYTTNTSDISAIIDSISVADPYYAIGSNLTLPYANMKFLLQSSKKKKDHHRVVFFIGDGELNWEEQSKFDLTIYEDIRSLINSGMVLGYGTPEGGKIKITSSLGTKDLTDSEGFLLDKTSTPYQPAISKLDENNLKELSGKLGIKYERNPSRSKLSSIVDEIIENAKKNKDDTEYSDKDLYYYLTMMLLIFLFLELFYNRRNEQ